MSTVNKNRVSPVHLIALVLIAIGVAAGLASFVLGEGLLPAGLVFCLSGIFMLFNRWGKND